MLNGELVSGTAGETLADGIGVAVGEEREGGKLGEGLLATEVLRVGGGREQLGVGGGQGHGGAGGVQLALGLDR